MIAQLQTILEAGTMENVRNSLIENTFGMHKFLKFFFLKFARKIKIKST
jgi:hypothetical protein